jgi:hypothetical protein
MTAAMGLVAASIENPPSDAIEFLSDCLAHQEAPWEHQYNQMPMGGALLDTLAAYLNLAPEPVRRQTAEQILDRIDQRGAHVSTLGALVLFLVLPRDRNHFAGMDGPSLSDLQRRAVACVARSTWLDERTLFGNAHDVLLAFQLPKDRQQMREFLGGAW